VSLQVDQTGTAAKENNLVPGLQQLASVHTAYHTSAKHKDPQQLSSPQAVVPVPVNRIGA
jgi:hypothetical protein